ncbi:hypothetical protein JWZ98_19860 [Methylomonas sp. EFPC1]|uniref:hypothetical protein n=1 Tax=Methylomonas sp. EFPC1 TaxID=2812647 RepID=UPI0019678566|nr:hypothetical protein [Methylomonas sp. EFPC1]QSB00880.1 hypothetical protein JWZ98_19860 [Methylomonas sp. EFPC1]
MNHEWPSIRVVHLKGGLRCTNEANPKCELYPASKNQSFIFNTSHYKLLYSSIESLNQEIIGIEFIDNSYQAKGADLPEWRAYNKSCSDRWINEEAAILWGNLGNSAYTIKDGRLWDLSNRISHQLRVCGWRVKELSDRYHEQLLAILERENHVKEIKFMDNFTWLCYLSIQTFLIDACILRDYLAEFIAAHIVDFHNIRNKNINSMSSLLKDIKKMSIEDVLIRELLSITSGNGWLKALGEYRDLVVHSAPIAQAEKILFANYKLIEFCNKKIPIIECPMPQDPSKASKARHSRSLFEDFDDLIKTFAGLTDAPSVSVDGLNYCHSTLGYLSNFAYKVGLRSRIEPTIKTISNKDIIGGFIYKKI